MAEDYQLEMHDLKQEKEGQLSYIDEDGDTNYIDTPLSVEEIKMLDDNELMDYNYAQFAGKYDDYDQEKISAMYEELARLREFKHRVMYAFYIFASGLAADLTTGKTTEAKANEEYEKALQMFGIKSEEYTKYPI